MDRYTYNPVGNRTSMRSLQDDVLHEYTYDAVDRLTRWQRGSDRFEEYVYDDVGNREQLTDEQALTTYSYDLANRLTQTVRQLTSGGTTTTTDLTWDPNGNLLSEQIEGGSLTTYTWDALNRLTALDGPTGSHTYGYDPTGIRVRETNGTETTRFLHADEDIVATYQGGTLATYFTHGPGIDEPWAQVRFSEADPLAYLHRDGLGSITAISSSEGQLHGTTTYSAFGSVEEATGLQGRYGFTSRELDPTGLMYYRARLLSAATGRFISRDAFRGFPTNPRSQNGYDYAEGNPVNLVDPSGFNAGTLAQPQTLLFLVAFIEMILAIGGALVAFVAAAAAVIAEILLYVLIAVLVVAIIVLIVYIVLFTYSVIAYWDEYEVAKRHFSQSKTSDPLPYGGPIPQPPNDKGCEELLARAQQFPKGSPGWLTFIFFYILCEGGDGDADPGTPQ